VININRGNEAPIRGVSLLPALLVACLVGCGGGADPDAVPAVPVAGMVTFKGKPLEEGTVQFVPEKGRAASGKIQGGQFVLTTYEPNDGAIPGKHAVGVTSSKSMPARPGAEPEAVSLIGTKYTSPGEAGIFFEIPAKGKEDIVIDLQ
jgi:hypothetical protein